MDKSYYILVLLFLLCLLIRTGYERLKEAGRVNPENRLVFAFIFTTMCALWALWFGLCPADPFQVGLPDVVRWCGLALFILGMILALGALFQLRGLENIDHLVTTGFFAKLRHPMYAGFILWILGWSTYHSAMVSLLAGLIGIVNVLYWRRLEEARLLKRYGETYQHYQSTTWF